MLLDKTMNFMEKILEELKETPAEKKDHFLASTLKIFEMGTEFLKESPEFRKNFLRIHAEFLKYPESKEMIEESIKAYNNYMNNK